MNELNAILAMVGDCPLDIVPEGLFSDLQVLTIMLTFCDRKINGSQVSRRLIDQFQTLEAIAAADPSALMRIDGLTMRSMTILKFLFALNLRTARSTVPKRLSIGNANQLKDYLIARLRYAPVEEVCTIFLDQDYRLIKDEVYSRGTINRSELYPRQIAARALELNATALIVAHNHPSRRATPSQQDVAITKKLQAACETLEIELLDHVIVAGDAFVSMRQLGLITKSVRRTESYSAAAFQTLERRELCA